MNPDRGQRPLRAVPDTLTALRPGRTVTLDIDAATERRVLAFIGRVERDEPGLGREPGESEGESFRVALGSLIDRGLAESEDDDGLTVDYMTGRLSRSRRVALRTRLRRAARTLRRG